METPERQHRNRPESILARNFSADLDSLFGLNSGAPIGNLSQTVAEKKRNVSSQEQELQALEDRLREAEQRLALASDPSSPSQNGQLAHNPTRYQASAGAQAVNRTVPVSSQQPPNSSLWNSAAAAFEDAPPSRPQNYREESFRPHIPGAMPRTPTQGIGAGSDYITVDRSR